VAAALRRERKEGGAWSSALRAGEERRIQASAAVEREPAKGNQASAALRAAVESANGPSAACRCGAYLARARPSDPLREVRAEPPEPLTRA